MLHGLGKTQQKVVRDLKNPNYYIEVLTDFRELKEEYTVCDDDLNSHYSITRITFKGLLNKKLIRKIESVGSLECEVTKFKLKTI